MDKVQVKSEKHFSACISFLLSFVLIFSFISCGNLFGSDDSGDSSDSKKIEKIDTNTEGDGKNTGTDSGDNDDGAPKYVTFKGTVFLSDSAKAALEVSSALKATDSTTSRSAIPSIEINGTDYYYFATATCTGQEDINGVFGGADGTRHDFELPLALGHTWNISAGIKKRAASGNAEDDVIVLSDSVPPVTIPLDFSGNFESYSFYVKPLSSGKGSVLLSMTVDSSVKKIRVSGSTSEWTSVLTPVLKEDGSCEAALNIPELNAGFYEVRFNFCDDNDIVLYSTVQTVNVFANLTTDSWKTSGGNSSIISAEGKFSVTDELIRQFRKNTVYVGENALSKASESSPEPSDFNTGTVYSPFLSLQQAINYIEANALEDGGSGSGSGGSGGSGTGGSGTSGSGAAGSQVYTVFVSGSVLSKIEKSTGTAAGVATIPATITSDKVSSINIQGVTGALCLTSGGSTVPAEINGGLTDAGENGSVLDIRTQVPVRFENIKITGANKTGSGSGGSGGTASDSDGGAVILRSGTSVTFANGTEISVNYCSGKGGAIFAEESFTVSGSIYIPAGTEENWKNDVYLADGKTVIIAGAISAPEGVLPAGAPVVMNITPENYGIDSPVLSASNSSLVEQAYSFFAVNDVDIDGVNVAWRLTNEGKLMDLPYARVQGISCYTKDKTVTEIKQNHSGESLTVILYRGISQTHLGSSATKGTIGNAIKETNAAEVSFTVDEAADIVFTGTSCAGMFKDCTKLKSVDLKGFNTADATSFLGMFEGCSNLQSLDISSIQTTSATNLKNMFSGCSSLTEIDVSGFDTKNVTDMSGMFASCSGVADFPVSNFSTENVTDISGMFESCILLSELDISGFDFSKAENFSGFFKNCDALETLSFPTGKEIAYTTDTGEMFSGCSALKSVNLSALKTSSVSSMKAMFKNCAALTRLDLCSFRAGAELTDISEMFSGCSNLDTIFVSKDLDFSSVSESAGSNMFKDCVKLVGGHATEFSTEHEDGTYACLDFCDYGNPGYFTAYVTVNDTAYDEVWYAKNAISGASGTINVYISGLVKAAELGRANLNGTLLYAVKGTSADEVNITILPNARLKPLTETVDSYYTRNNTYPLFGDCAKLKKADLRGLDISELTSLSAMFYQAGISEVNLEGWNFSNVTNLYSMFERCDSLETFTINGWELPNCTNMGYLFYSCKNIKEINIIDIKADNPVHGSDMFGWCESLEKLNIKTSDPSNPKLQISRAEQFCWMCTKLSDFDFSGLDTSKSTCFNSAFQECKGFVDVDLRCLDTSSCTSAYEMFRDCTNLKYLNIASFSSANLNSAASMFYGCSSLERIITNPDFKLTMNSSIFTNCVNLKGCAGTSYSSVTNPSYSSLGQVDGINGEQGFFSVYASIDDTYFYQTEDVITSIRNATGEITLKLYNILTPSQIGSSESASDCVAKAIHDSNASINLVVIPDCGVVLGDENIALFKNCESLKSVDLCGIDAENFTDFSSFFENCTNLETINLVYTDYNNLKQIKMPEISTVSIDNMFAGCSNLDSIYTALDFTGAHSSTGAFSGCTKLTGCHGTQYDDEKTDASYACLDLWDDKDPSSQKGYFSAYMTIDNTPVFNYPHFSSYLYSFSVPVDDEGEVIPVKIYLSKNVTESEFGNTYTENTILYKLKEKKDSSNSSRNLKVDLRTNLKTKLKLSTCKDLFQSFTGLVRADLRGLDFSECTSCENMFKYSGIAEVDLTGCDFSNITTMMNMFYSCDSLTSFTIEDWDLPKLETMEQMFSGCNILESLVVKNVETAAPVDCKNFVSDGSNIKTVSFIADDSSKRFKVSNAGYMFNRCPLLETINLNGLDTSLCTNMRSMFETSTNSSSSSSTVALVNLDVSMLDTSSCTDMSQMFQGCVLTFLDLSNFDTSNVTTMYSMFGYCKNLERIIASDSFVVDNVSEVESIFSENCYKLKGGAGTAWNSNRKKKDYAVLDGVDGKEGCLTTYAAVGGQTCSNVQEVCDKIRNATGEVDVILFNIITPEELGNSDAADSVAGAIKASSASINLSFPMKSNFIMTNTNTALFKNCTSLKSVCLSGVSNNNSEKITDLSNFFSGCSNLETVVLYEDAPGSYSHYYLSTNYVTDMSNMFKDCEKLSTLDLTYETCKTENVESMAGMFQNCSSLETLDLSLFNNTKLKESGSIENMFNGCSNLSTIFVTDSFQFDEGTCTGDHVFDGCDKLSGINGSKITDAGLGTSIDYARVDSSGNLPGYFSCYAIVLSATDSYVCTNNNVNSRITGCATDVKIVLSSKVIFSDLKQIISDGIDHWSSSTLKDLVIPEKVHMVVSGTELKELFKSVKKLRSADLRGLDVSECTNVSKMFYECENLESLNLSGWQLGKTVLDSPSISFEELFKGCKKLKTVDFTDFDTSRVNSMKKMFYDCNVLEQLDLSSFDTSGVTDMSYMFQYCYALTDIDVSSFNTSSVTTMSSMFYNCYALTALDVSSFNTSSVTAMSYMFYNCKALTVLDVSSFNTSSVTTFDSMFSGCTELTTIKVSDSFVVASDKGPSMFKNDQKLIGGAGTTYSASNYNATYAHIDGGTDNPGYFTRKE